MIDKKVAAALTDRLSGLNWYPRDGVAQIELIRAVESAENEFIGTHVVTEWIRYETDCPKPAELRALINTENQKLYAEREAEAEAERSRRTSCPKCHGFGIVESLKGRTMTPIESVCSYCSCSDGRRREQRSAISSNHPGWDEYSVPAIMDARRRLLKRFGKASVSQIVEGFAQERTLESEPYHGEF